jgi:hypothetical protein
MVGANGAAKPPRKEDGVACQDRHALPRCAGLSKKQFERRKSFCIRNDNLMSKVDLQALMPTQFRLHITDRGLNLTVMIFMLTLGGVFYFYGRWGGLLSLQPSATGILTMIASLLVRLDKRQRGVELI